MKTLIGPRQKIISPELAELKLDILERHKPLNLSPPEPLFQSVIESLSSHTIDSKAMLGDFGLGTRYWFDRFRFQLGTDEKYPKDREDNDEVRRNLLSRFLGEPINSFSESKREKTRIWHLKGERNDFQVTFDGSEVGVKHEVGEGIRPHDGTELVWEEYRGGINVYSRNLNTLDIPQTFRLRSLYKRMNVGEIKGAKVFTACMGIEMEKHGENEKQVKHWIYPNYPEGGASLPPKEVCSGHVERKNLTSVSAKYHLIKQDHYEPFLLIYPIQLNRSPQFRDRGFLMASVGFEMARALGVKNIATPDIDILERPREIRFSIGTMLQNHSPDLFGGRFIQRYRMMHNWMENQREFNVFKWDGILPVIG